MRRRSVHPFLFVAILSFNAVPARPVEPPAERSRAGVCSDGAARLCLLGRFEVEAAWLDRGGRERVAAALTVTAQGGAFSFFAADGADLLVQIDDGRRPDGRFGVRLGALTDAAFTLRVRDTSNGATWSYENPRGHFAAWNDPLAFLPDAPSAPDFAPPAADSGEGDSPVADFLEGRTAEVESGAAIGVAQGGPCRGSATDLCLLGGRFRVRAVDARGTRYGAALPAGETGLFALDRSGRADVAVRVVDGRAVNGNFWVLASALGATDVEVEVADLEGGSSRRFLLPGGSPNSRFEPEAFSAAAATVQVTLDTGRAKTQTVGPLGGSIQVTDARGAKFLLAFPAQALDGLTEVTVTPVAAIAGLPFSGGLKAGVRIEPEGLIPAASVLLTITPAAPVAPAQQLTFAFRGLAGELYLTPPRANQTAIVIPVHRLGGYGLGAGSTADLAAQLLRLPSREEDRLAQRLAGLLLPLRRAGGPPRALPASVLQLLQSEFTARIKPKLLLIQQGQVLKYLPVTRNFSNTVKDTGLTSSVTGSGLVPRSENEGVAMRSSAVDQIRAAEIAGARRVLASNLATCAGRGGVAAATKAYRAYMLLKSRGALAPTDTTKLLNCVHFELRFDTDLSMGDQHDTVPLVRLPLTLNLAQGYFYARVLTPQTASLNQADCTATETSRTVGGLDVDQLLINRLGQWEDELLSGLVPQVVVFYKIDPLPMVIWSVHCDAGMTFRFPTSWATIYTYLHVDEVARHGTTGGFFRMVMDSSADPRKLAEKPYQREQDLLLEDTLFDLFHTPR